MAEFSNPNQQGGQEGRSLMAMMVVFVAVVLGLQLYRAKTAPPPSSTPPPAAQQMPATPAASPASLATPQPAASAKSSAPSVPSVEASAESATIVENNLYRITFSNRGAQVTSWILKDYKDLDGKPLDLIHQQAAKLYGYPLSLYTSDASIASALNQALYVPSAKGQLTAPASLSFKYSNGGLQATKTFTFDPKTYVLHAEVAVTRAGAPVAAQLSWPGGFGDQNEDPRGNDYNYSQIDQYRNGNFSKTEAKSITAGGSLSGPFDFAGVADPFFAAVFIPDSPDTATVTTLRNDLDVSKFIKRVGFGSDSPPTKPLVLPVLGAALGDSSGPIETRIFVGPKAISVLKSVRATDSRISLEPMLEFGFWGPIAKYLFLSLQAIHAHITANWSGSWGWAIIVLTLFINLLIMPFRVKSMHSALKMQRIQPQMDAIKEKYKKYKVTDPKRGEMNAEIMQLQKDNGVSMFGGCIPQLITMPLIIAFFYMLPKVVELRLAHWFWLPNLQAPDPHHILPIFMVLSQFLVQFYTPSPGVDPQQQKMMAFMMPLFSGYITWQYASGLALYWSVGNLIGIAQQSVMNQTSLGREMRAMAAKRARRKGGGGGTIQGRK
ncbi:MAG: membrane protein insertase YidC [Acidobacteriaceae bacterium]